jgi:hypothetical protein
MNFASKTIRQSTKNSKRNESEAAAHEQSTKISQMFIIVLNLDLQ